VTRVLGLDYGTKRVGIAISDPSRLIAHPLEVVALTDAIDRITELVGEHDVSQIVVGLPTSLSGAMGDSAAAAREFGAVVADATGQPVEFVDERFSSKTAEEALLATGMKRRKRRQTVDKVAATVILQSFLDRLH
jgi:putative Holliday junction resolvase